MWGGDASKQALSEISEIGGVQAAVVRQGTVLTAT